MVRLSRTLILTAAALAGFGGRLGAAPSLTLSATSLQVAATAGSNGPTQTVQAQNTGDGSLNLQVFASAPWLSATVGASHACSSSSAATCLPIGIALETASLASGLYAGIVTVYDPNAINAPQLISVAVAVGAGVPAQIGFWVTPGASLSAQFSTATSALVTAQSAANWLTVMQNGGSPFSPSIPFLVTASSGALAGGDYPGTVAVVGSSINSENRVIQATMHVVAEPITGPLTSNILNISTYLAGESLGQGDWAAIFGISFYSGNPVQAQSAPYATTLGEVQVMINGQPVGVQYVSATQINVQIPYETPVGGATVQVVSNGTKGNTLSFTVARAVPRIMRINAPGFGDDGIIVNASDNSFAIPVTAGLNSRPAKLGDYIVIYAVGFGPTNPTATSGAPAPSSPLAKITDSPMVCFTSASPFDPNSLCETPQFAGLTPTFVGLYQINVQVPDGAPTGNAIPIFINTSDGMTNTVTMAIAAK